MPNTIAHFAIHGLVTRGAMPKANLPLIYLGCIVPDIPWIIQRAATGLIPGIDPYALRLYCVNQASLFVSLIFGAAVAALMVRWKSALCVLSLGSLTHLLLDACEIKWGNGVSLWVPWDWSLFRFDFVWPESPVIAILTLCGLIYFLIHLRVAARSPVEFSKRPQRWALAAFLFVAYVALPALWSKQALAADNHYVDTLRPEQSDARQGKPVALDRIPYLAAGAGEGELIIWGGEKLQTNGMNLARDAKVSVQGRMSGQHSVEVEHSHVHHSWMREVATYIGLVLVAFVWISSILGKRFPRNVDAEDADA